MNDKKYFAISDVHSFYDEMIYALGNKNFDIDNDNHILILCGDAFDRGYQTIQVFEFLKLLHSKGRLIYIKGNHEDLLKDCLREFVVKGNVGSHHYSNGTVKTISHFVGGDDYWVYSTYVPTDIINDIVKGTKEVLNFISDIGVNYFTLGNKIFTHSWIPCIPDSDNNKYHSRKDYKCIDPIWNVDRDTIEDIKKKLEYDIAWQHARWGNPFQQWKSHLYPEGKCIVFGHWHTSWYWSHVKQERKEWPEKNRKEWWRSFDPIIEENIIGLDGCVAYSGKINCIVFDENGEVIN